MTVFRLANLTYQWGRDERLVRQLAAGAHGDALADVLILVEARDAANEPVPVAQILGPGWDVSQDTSSGARAGSVIATRRPQARTRWSLARLLSRAGRRVQSRYMRVAAVRDDLGVARVAALHNPLRSTHRQDDAVDAATSWVNRQRRRRKRWLVGTDANMHHTSLRADLAAPHSFGKDVMAFVWSEGWGDVICTATKYDSTDHAVLTLTTKENR